MESSHANLRLYAILFLPFLVAHPKGANAVPQDEPVSSTQPANNRQHWLVLLQKYGTAFSLRFTIERDDYDHASGSPLLAHYVLSPAKLKDKNEFLDLLKKWIPEASIEADPAIPGLIHIREKSLQQRKGYILNEKTTISYKGTFRGLLEELAKRSHNGLEQSLGGGVSEVPYPPDTQTAVDVTNGSFRDVLSKAITPNSDRILWEAILVNRGNKPLLLIKVNGPNNPIP